MIPILLNDNDRDARFFAAGTLGFFSNTATSLTAFGSALGDNDGEVRWAAVWALDQFNDSEAAPSILPLTKDVQGYGFGNCLRGITGH